MLCSLFYVKNHCNTYAQIATNFYEILAMTYHSYWYIYTKILTGVAVSKVLALSISK
jgi:hypothetical protein